ncbi:hypothetical protein BGX38DRAFT_1278320 [Terfezia claveryi]|nr:hypothetical protein BGX38DRAFT_1278320 [Terfezia claveryi]
MRRYMNGVPYTESTVATTRASFDQHNESGDLNAGMLEPPMELNPRLSADSFILRRRSQRGLGNSSPRTKQFPRRKPVSPRSPVFSASGTSIQSAGSWGAAYDKRSTDNTTPGTKHFPRQKPVSPLSPGHPCIRTLNLHCKEMESNWGIYRDNTPILTTRTSYGEDREALEKLVLTDPRHMHWLRVMLDRSDENLLLDSTKAVGSVVRSACGGSTNRILRLHEQKVPIIKVPVPLRELATDDSVPTHLVRHNALNVEAPTPGDHGTSAASLGGNTQQISSHLKIPARVSPKNLTQTPQQRQRLFNYRLLRVGASAGLGFGGCCRPNRSSRLDH